MMFFGELAILSDKKLPYANYESSFDHREIIECYTELRI